MNGKEPRDKKDVRPKQGEGFQEPAPRGGQDAESEEEVQVEGFADPKIEEDYTEDAASVQAEATTSGIPQRLR